MLLKEEEAIFFTGQEKVAKIDDDSVKSNFGREPGPKIVFSAYWLVYSIFVLTEAPPLEFSYFYYAWHSFIVLYYSDKWFSWRNKLQPKRNNLNVYELHL